jgi:hydrogenase maturation protein HypF
VLKVFDGREYFIRRSRGYAPFPIKMDIDLKPILACGAEQKASFAISKDKYIFISQHIGDLKNYETLRHYEEQIENFKKLFKIEPKIIACDLHPDYLSTNYAEEKYRGLDIIKVQHHHAHMVSCMADNCLHDNVIGITWDGTGYGTDGTIWGGEILVGNYSWFQRKGTFLSTAMPGGDRAVKDVYSMALSYMIKTFGADYKKYINLLPFPEGNERNMDLIYRMVDKKINSPVTTSCGRLFDGVSGMLGLCSITGYEGQGAVRLEAAARANTGTVLKYDVYMQNGMYIFDWRGTIDNIIELLKQKADISFIASAFHNTVVDAAVSQVSLIREDTGINKVVLSGGVFQNNLILLKLKERLREVKFDVYIHRRVSANDEGISVGQLIAAQNGGDFNVSCSTVKNNINR